MRWLTVWLFCVTVLLSGVLAAIAEGGTRARSLLVSSGDAFVSEARVAVGAGGEAVAVWNQQIASSGSSLVFASRSVEGAGWSAPQVLDRSMDGATVFEPEVAMAPSGAVAIVWQQEGPVGGLVIEGVVRASADAPWTAPEVIARGWLSTSRELGIDAAGDAVLVYVATSSAAVDAVTFDRSAGRWSVPVALGTVSRDELANPTVAVNAQGQAVAAWSTLRRPPEPIAPGLNADDRYDSWVVAAVMRAGVWSTAQRLGAETQFVFDLDWDATPDGPQVAIDDRGRAIVVWEHDATGLRLAVNTAVLGAGASRWKLLPAVAPYGSAAELVASPDGWTTLAWEAAGSGIATRSGPISGCCWTASTTFARSATRADFDLNLVAGPGHGAALAFAENGEPIQLAVHPTTGTHWNRAVAIGTEPADGRSEPIPQALAVSPTGQLLAAWTQETPSSIPGFLNAPLSATTATEH